MFSCVCVFLDRAHLHLQPLSCPECLTWVIKKQLSFSLKGTSSWLTGVDGHFARCGKYDSWQSAVWEHFLNAFQNKPWTLNTQLLNTWHFPIKLLFTWTKAENRLRLNWLNNRSHIFRAVRHPVVSTVEVATRPAGCIVTWGSCHIAQPGGTVMCATYCSEVRFQLKHRQGRF